MKLKESVDLKELEKYGYHYDFRYGQVKKIDMGLGSTLTIIVQESSKNIKGMFSNMFADDKWVNEKVLENIKDLIKKGLVE